MLHSLSGTLASKRQAFAVVDVRGVGYKVHVPARVHEALPEAGEPVFLYCHFVVREDAQDLYGFLAENDLVFFEKLLTVNGVGPKSALAVMALATPHELASAITEGRADVFMRAAGVGKKTAERVVLELRGKLPVLDSEGAVRRMESDMDVEEALVGLGYSAAQAKRALADIPKETKGIENRLRAALKLVKKP